jgi:hypothetical protein
MPSEEEQLVDYLAKVRQLPLLTGHRKDRETAAVASMGDAWPR